MKHHLTSTLVAISVLAFFIGCSSSEFAGSTTPVPRDGAADSTKMGTTTVNTGTGTPTVAPGGTPAPTPTGTGTGGLGSDGGTGNGGGGLPEDGFTVDSRFAAFWVSADDRAVDRVADPVANPYTDFTLCFRGKFGQVGNDIISLAAQTVQFDLGKYCGCSAYSVDLTVKEKDGTIKLETRNMDANGKQTTSIALSAGSVLGVILHITGRGGGCETGHSRTVLPIGGDLTSFKAGGYAAVGCQ